MLTRSNRRRFLKTAALTLAASGKGLFGSAPAPGVDLSRLTSPILFRGNSRIAYRDPAVLFHQGIFHLYFSYVRLEEGKMYWYLGYSRSADLLNWTKPDSLSPRDRDLNFSSPGNIIRYQGEWILCLQTYPTPNDEIFGNQDARIWIRRSQNLRRWSEPELLRVKGENVPVHEMGRMIDPYLVQDKDIPGKWWCFFDDDAAYMSYSYDLKQWTYSGRIDSGENACVLVDNDEYLLFHSPRNGVGMKRSPDMRHWRDTGDLIRLGQKDWPWAQGRLTAGFVIDLRQTEVGKYLMFFHGSSRAGLEMHRAHGHASLGLAWSEDLVHWDWPG